MFVDYTAQLCLESVFNLNGKGLFRRASVVEIEGDLSYSWKTNVHENMRPVELSTLRTLFVSYDQNTGEHAVRTMHLVQALARQLQLSQEKLRISCLAALLHDIGKTVLPAAILDKVEPLTEDEWKMMRMHPVIGQQILQRAGGIFSSLQHIVAAHHERMDGRGYPAGLFGEEIPFEARMLAVVDSYDAMTSYRAYQQPLPGSEARAELQRCAGRQYDAHIVTAFLQALDEWDHTIPDVIMPFSSSSLAGRNCH